MREIKFRFWSKHLNHFVKPDDSIFVGALKDPDMIVMQYTGLKDKNGKEIFEGDIFTFKCNHCRNIHRAKIIWIEDLACWGLDDGKQQSPLQSPLSYSDMVVVGLISIEEVIGNIWENPELLKS